MWCLVITCNILCGKADMRLNCNLPLLCFASSIQRGSDSYNRDCTLRIHKESELNIEVALFAIVNPIIHYYSCF